MRATVAIVSYRTPELAGRCLASVVGQPRREEWLHYAEIVETGEDNVGYAAALARVFDGAQTELLIALNADTAFPAQDITPLLEIFDEHPRMGVIGPRQVDSQGYLRHCGIDQPGATHGGPSFGEPDVGQFSERLRPVAQVSGSIMFIRRAAYEDVGGLANMPTLYYEDAILCRRMRMKGWRVGYAGELTFIHDIASSPSTSRVALAAAGARAWREECMS